MRRDSKGELLTEESPRVGFDTIEQVMRERVRPSGAAALRWLEGDALCFAPHPEAGGRTIYYLR
ncbi:MAG: hypothetical protein HY268_07160 [Deltaproteobacteria bacterium]|nr:hypothetical protein [Deltaproteobacteria bacterium]